MSGLDPASLRAWMAREPRSPDWQKVLSIHAGQDRLVDDLNVPPMLGRYAGRGNVLVFVPEFPLQPGLRYRAEFRPAALPGADASAKPIIAHLAVTAPIGAATTSVKAVYPSAPELPENLLKFYLHFSAPMSRGHIYGHIRLLDDVNKAVDLPFLELDEELWNPEMTRLTLFIDPGRIKRGVKPLEEIGPALEQGRSYTLVIDRDWRDAAGNPLKEDFRRQFKVGAPDREPPDPQRWRIIAPSAGTRAPLMVGFGESMDEALARRMIRVVDARSQVIAGSAEVADHERTWSFTPDEPWPQGRLQLEVQATIEDLAGNNIGKPFEVDVFNSVARKLTSESVTIPFEVR